MDPILAMTGRSHIEFVPFNLDLATGSAFVPALVLERESFCARRDRGGMAFVPAA